MTIRLMLALAAILVLANVGGVMAQQQVNDDSKLVWNSVGSAALQTRRPGQLIDSGVLRHSESQARAFGRPEISESGDTISLPKQIRIIAIQTLFQNLNAALLAFDNLIRAQAGFAPFTGLPITPNLRDSLL